MTTYPEVDLYVSLAAISMGDATKAQQMRASREYDRAVAESVKLTEALKDCRSGLIYIRECYGELYGVGFDRAIGRADAALSQQVEANHE